MPRHRRIASGRNPDLSLDGRDGRWGVPSPTDPSMGGRAPPEVSGRGDALALSSGLEGTRKGDPFAKGRTGGPTHGVGLWQALAADYVSPRVLYELREALATPLAPMKLQVDLLRKGYLGPLNDEQAFSLGVLARNMERVVRVLSDLLDEAGVRAGRPAKRRAASPS